MTLTADLVNGQKTGFFLDQRDNRLLIRKICRNLTVLNLFSYSGGFSIAAGIGAAKHVTSVDVAQKALQAAVEHWELNKLDIDKHAVVAQDCFEFLEQSIEAGRKWDIVICDPPSFAPNQKTIPTALAAYAKLAHLACSVVKSGGLLALASCSSHVNSQTFTEANLAGFSRGRRTVRLLSQLGLPPDHPIPLVMQELSYLKFHLHWVD